MAKGLLLPMRFDWQPPYAGGKAGGVICWHQGPKQPQGTGRCRVGSSIEGETSFLPVFPIE